MISKFHCIICGNMAYLETSIPGICKCTFCDCKYDEKIIKLEGVPDGKPRGFYK